MRYVLYGSPQGARWGVLEGDRARAIRGSLLDRWEPTGEAHALADLRLLPPCEPRPRVAGPPRSAGNDTVKSDHDTSPMLAGKLQARLIDWSGHLGVFGSSRALRSPSPRVPSFELDLDDECADEAFVVTPEARHGIRTKRGTLARDEGTATTRLRYLQAPPGGVARVAFNQKVSSGATRQAQPL